MIIQKIAGELIQPGQAVYLGADEQAYIYKNSDRGNIGKFLGFSLNRSSVINIIDILTEGEILDGFLIEGNIEFLIGNSYYIDSDGYPTRIIPSAPAFIHEIGVALNNNKLYIIDRFDKSALQIINVNTDSFEGDGTIGDPLDLADKADDALYSVRNGEFVQFNDTVDVVLEWENWESTLEQTILVAGLKSTGIIMVAPDPTGNHTDNWAKFGIKAISGVDGEVTFICTDWPDEDINVIILILKFE